MKKIAELFLKIYPIERISAKRRMLLHCIFWAINFVFVWITCHNNHTGLAFNFITISYFIILDIIYFYIITYVIIPLWSNYHKYKYIITILCIAALILCLFVLFYIRVQFIFDNNLTQGSKVDFSYLKRFYNDYTYLFKSGQITSAILGIFLTALPAFFIKLTRSLAKSFSEKKQTEIDYLRSQINPHFLTNTLNNIYSLSVTDDKRNSDAILSLSSLLDYVLYEANQPTISLEKEVSFLSNFIELEKMRNTKRLQVSFEIQGDIHGSIPPMILITFVENAFKHSIGDLFSNCFIKILLKVDNEKLYFEVENSKSNLPINNQRKTFGGIGLTNVKKRLATLSPETHSLQIKNEENVYVVKLQLELM
ncbi:MULTISPECIES: histidine kinase [unclassified Arcicella]|uniref:sensor histidine kinase n=1 Tax=unclassified Arcicella TaxID=2644986 RepID=UPI0028615759|nr:MULTISPECIES: histidine kinase [unclassified Arcicella]MDR6563950.1 sensor histidine kinase YesM [Arcicella sp. BE51]MDR6813703.1 sensor histidine kinase YesM [Arcicella sp. BE140]MDR6824916.1 sensor histidine kinase YesM [Arcicella sp. BE139]